MAELPVTMVIGGGTISWTVNSGRERVTRAVAELLVIMVVDGGGISRTAAISFVSDESSS